MFDSATTALLRAVLDEVCEDVSPSEVGLRRRVAFKILRSAARGDDLRQIGRDAPSRTPTMFADRAEQE